MKRIITAFLLSFWILPVAVYAQTKHVHLVYSSYGGGLPGSVVELSDDTNATTDTQQPAVNETVENTDTTESNDTVVLNTEKKKSTVNTKLIIGITVGVVAIAATTVAVIYLVNSAQTSTESCSQDCTNWCVDESCSFLKSSQLCNSSTWCNSSSLEFTKLFKPSSIITAFGLMPIYVP